MTAVKFEDYDASVGLSEGEFLVQEMDNTDEDTKTYIYWNTNLMGALRVLLSATNDGSNEHIGYTVMFIMLVVFTLMFLVVYIKRIIYLAFLTIISPLVALTYPIDKASDGQAQGFNIWFKEYMFNLLLQPMHLLLYTVLVSSAIDLALTNMIYAIIVLGFLTQGEKILRKLFNFQKADTPGVLGGATGTALAMSGIKWLTGRGPHVPHGNGDNAGGSSSGENSSGENKEDGKTVRGPNQVTWPWMNNENSGKNDNAGTDSAANNGSGSDTENPIDASGTDQPGTRTDADNGGNGSDNDGTDNNSDGDDTDSKDKRKNPKGAINRARQNYKDGKGRISGIKNYLSDVAANMEKKGKLKNMPKDLKGRFIRVGLEAGKKVAKTAPKVATSAIGAATFGTAALGIGAATGNPNEAVKDTLAGLAGGAKLGSKIGDSVIETVSGTLPGKDAYMRGKMTPDEYEKWAEDKAREEAKSNEDNIKAVQEKFGKDRAGAEEMLEGNKDTGEVGMIDYYRDNGITDINEMNEIEEVAISYQEKNANLSQKQARDKAVVGRDGYKRYNVSSLKTKKDWDEVTEAAKDFYGEKAGPEVIREARNYDIAINKRL